MPSIPSDGPQLSLVEMVEIVLRRWRLVAYWSVGSALVTLVLLLVLPRNYTASATFYPQVSSSSLSALAGLAAQFGVGVPEQDPSQTPEFYVALVQSDGLLGRVVDTRFHVGSDTLNTAATSLADYWGVRGAPGAERRERTIIELGRRLSVTSNRQVGLVSVALTDRDPELAFEVVRRTVQLLNDFNVQERKTQAGMERRFVQALRDSAALAMGRATDTAQAFLARNRDFHNSPQLQFRYDRLMQELQMRQATYTALSQSLDQARIEEVRNTPVITTIDGPAVPALPDRRHGGVKVFLALIGGAAVALGLIAFQEWVRRARVAAPEVMASLRGACEQLPILGRWLRRGAGR